MLLLRLVHHWPLRFPHVPDQLQPDHKRRCKSLTITWVFACVCVVSLGGGRWSERSGVTFSHTPHPAVRTLGTENAVDTLPGSYMYVRGIPLSSCILPRCQSHSKMSQVTPSSNLEEPLQILLNNFGGSC